MLSEKESGDIGNKQPGQDFKSLHEKEGGRTTCPTMPWACYAVCCLRGREGLWLCEVSARACAVARLSRVSQQSEVTVLLPPTLPPRFASPGLAYLVRPVKGPVYRGSPFEASALVFSFSLWQALGLAYQASSWRLL